VDGTGLVRNTQYYLATRKFATAQPQLVHALLEELDHVDQWGRDNVPDVAKLLSPLVGLDQPGRRRINHLAKRRTAEIPVNCLRTKKLRVIKSVEGL